jgi:actin-related protein
VDWASAAVEWISALIQGLATVLGILAAAYLATRGYRGQKKADREAELEKQKAESYVRFLNAFGDANRLIQKQQYDREAHEDAKEEYLRAFTEMFLLASPDVLEKANEFHRLVARPEGEDGTPSETKRSYAEVLRRMRKDAFQTTEETDLTAENIGRWLPID